MRWYEPQDNWYAPRNIKSLGVPFALDASGRWRDVSEVASGAKCGCVCPDCAWPLWAKKGPEKSHHFAHSPGAECRHAVEASLFGMAMELLATPGASLTLPGCGELHNFVERFKVTPDAIGEVALSTLNDRVRDKKWIVPSRKIKAPNGFAIRARTLKNSKPDEPDLIEPEEKLAVHFLSYRKGCNQIREAKFDADWLVLGISLNYYVNLWWEVCDTEKKDKIAEAGVARDQMRSWLENEDTGRGVLHVNLDYQGQYKTTEKKFHVWLEKKRGEQNRRREIERQEAERRKAEAAKWQREREEQERAREERDRESAREWTVPSGDETLGGIFFKLVIGTDPFCKRSMRERLRKHPVTGEEIYAEASGHVVPVGLRDQLSNTPWKRLPCD